MKQNQSKMLNNIKWSKQAFAVSAGIWQFSLRDDFIPKKWKKSVMFVGWVLDFTMQSDM